jgi:hypothetical protein
MVKLLNECLKSPSDESRGQLRALIAGYADARSMVLLERLEQALRLGEEAVSEANKIAGMLDAALERERKLLEGMVARHV